MAQKKRKSIRNKHTVYIGDSRVMQPLGDESAHLAIASPPEWSPESGAPSGHIGSSFEIYEEYLMNLALVWEECYRVLHRGCRLCVHVPGGAGAVYAAAGDNPCSALTGIQVSCACAGFEREAVITWQKEDQNEKRPEPEEAYLVPRNTLIRGEADCILVFKKEGDGPEPDEKNLKKSKLSKNEGRRLGSNLWVFPDTGRAGRAKPFPVEVAQRLIKMYSLVGETVVDPFAGSGATVAAAKNLGRSSVSFELDSGMEEVIRKRATGDRKTRSFFTEECPAPDEKELAGRLKGLAQRLLPGGSDGGESPAKKTSGQDKSSRKKAKTSRERISVSGVYNIDHLIVEGGRDVRLAGIEVPGEFFSRNPGVYRQSIDYLKQLVVGKELEVKQPRGKAGENNSMYVYLEDGETANEKLIRGGCALSAQEPDHELKKKFDKLEKQARDRDMGMWALKKTDRPRKGKR